MTKQKDLAFPGLTDGHMTRQFQPQGDKGFAGSTEAPSDTSRVTESSGTISWNERCLVFQVGGRARKSQVRWKEEKSLQHGGGQWREQVFWYRVETTAEQGGEDGRRPDPKPTLAVSRDGGSVFLGWSVFGALHRPGG